MKPIHQLLLSLLACAFMSHGTPLLGADDSWGTTLTLTVNGDKTFILNDSDKKDARYDSSNKKESLSIYVLARYSGFWKVNFEQHIGEKLIEKTLNLPKQSTKQEVFPGYTIETSIK